MLKLPHAMQLKHNTNIICGKLGDGVVVTVKELFLFDLRHQVIVVDRTSCMVMGRLDISGSFSCVIKV